MNQHNEPLEPVMKLAPRLEAQISEIEAKEKELQNKIKNLRAEQMKLQNAEKELKAEQAHLQAQQIELEDRLQEIRNEL